ncbi:MAG: LSM domain-containing protein [Thermoplasmata archaeon]|nr:LSM domain-containing protein [Thermoplasmata archaeon]
MSGNPAALIERLVQQPVHVQLKDGRVLTGKLVGLDEHLNIVLDDSEETTKELSRRLGRVVLRGSNVVSLNAPPGGIGRAP